MRLVTLHDLARMSNRTVQEVLYTAQEANAVKLQPGDSNIYIDVDIFQEHLDEIIEDELRTVNCK